MPEGRSVHWWLHILREVAKRMPADGIMGRAAQMSFYFFLSVFPMLVILMAVLGLFLDAQWLIRDALIARLSSVAPESMMRLFERLLDHLGTQPGAPLTWGVVIALWAASSGMVATIRGLNIAYDITEERPWWRRRLFGLALTLGFMLLLAVAMLLLAYGVPIAEALAFRMGLGEVFLLAWRLGQWPLIFGFVLLAFELLYRYAPKHPPDSRHIGGRWLQPGTLIAIALWLAASLGLKFFVANFGQYNVAYGSLGAVIVLLLWFYLTAIVILAGAEMNAQLEKARSIDAVGESAQHDTAMSSESAR